MFRMCRPYMDRLAIGPQCNTAGVIRYAFLQICRQQFIVLLIMLAQWGTSLAKEVRFKMSHAHN